MKARSYFFVFLIFVILFSCDEEESVEQSIEFINLVEDGNLEQESHGWEFFNVYDGVVTNEHHVENVDTENFLAPGNYSLSISSDSIGGARKYSVWRYGIDIESVMNNNLTIDMRMVIKASIKGENLQGDGVSIAVSKYGTALETLKTTQNKHNIIGTFDFIQYTLTTPFDPDTDTVYIYMVMLNSTGTAYFDNIEAYLETY